MKKKAVILITIILASLALFGAQAVISSVYWGMRGTDVRAVQQKLIQYGYMSGSADGVFGQKTYTAVVAFQKKNGLKADGVVGASTAAALGLGFSGNKTAAVSSEYESEVYLLAQLVSGEARGEPYLGQVAVAAVVLNRVKHPSFPNSIAGVIYQKGAFDAVSDGQIYLPVSDDCIRAARDALAGWDPTGGCTYYYNPATATSAWIWTRQVNLTIGRHAFAV
ncbi:MAG: spore cortex-lytic enzyme [Eubacteriales bacterium]|nr:spore cortex-lytic enzyme [Eubacteriales bacterium]MDD3881523.1 spore cortex-lytic enzyme [Eubacteriales bacterium]MDD4512995.1 spore cortex-lytic enzyme [Eubacteriales bacterium]